MACSEPIAGWASAMRVSTSHGGGFARPGCRSSGSKAGGAPPLLLQQLVIHGRQHADLVTQRRWSAGAIQSFAIVGLDPLARGTTTAGVESGNQGFLAEGWQCQVVDLFQPNPGAGLAPPVGAGCVSSEFSLITRSSRTAGRWRASPTPGGPRQDLVYLMKIR
jgi:hypothetical protein